MFLAAPTPPRLTTLILLAALSVLPVNMFVPSLANIAATFRVDYAVAALAVAGYATGTATLQLFMGPLSDRVGRRPVLLVALAVFAGASVGCALAPDIRVFLGFRLLQGVIIAGYVVSMAVIRDITRPERVASLIGYVATAWAIAPMLGPTLGGALDALFGWRASFWTFAGLGVAALALCWLDLGETNRTPSATLAAQLRAYPALLRSRRFWGCALCMAFSTGVFYAFLGGAPLVARTALGLSPAALGIAMGTMTAGFMTGSFLAGRYAGRFPLATTMVAGRILACVGLAAGMALALSGVTGVIPLFVPCIVAGIGNGLTMPASSAGALSVRPDLAGSASGLAGALTVAGGAAMSALSGAVVESIGGPPALLGVMLLSASLALLAALDVRRQDRCAA